jgi:mannose-6-phosphate isomerase-like protein (cupin superfamily)
MSPPETVKGDGYAVGHVDGIGEGPGFRKVRRALDVSAFGVNAIVVPPGVQAGFHFHDEQEELYLVLRGTVEMEFGDGSKHRMGPGGLARVDASTHRRYSNPGEDEAVIFAVGGKGGYVGRDGRLPEGEEGRVREGRS